MSRSRRINPKAAAQRGTLRTVGWILVGIGGIFTAVGLGSFFSAFGSHGSPDKFWCAFVGLPMLGFGFTLLKMGYMGTVARYVAGEAAPVVSDSLNYLADETRGSVRKTAHAVSAGMSQRETSEAHAECPSCSHANDHDARFCSQCGEGIAQPIPCPKCHNTNDADARFCNDCGTSLV